MPPYSWPGAAYVFFGEAFSGPPRFTSIAQLLGLRPKQLDGVRWELHAKLAGQYAINISSLFHQSASSQDMGGTQRSVVYFRVRADRVGPTFLHARFYARDSRVCVRDAEAVEQARLVAAKHVSESKLP